MKRLCIVYSLVVVCSLKRLQPSMRPSSRIGNILLLMPYYLAGMPMSRITFPACILSNRKEYYQNISPGIEYYSDILYDRICYHCSGVFTIGPLGPCPPFEL